MKIQDISWQNNAGLKIFARSWIPEEKVKASILLVHGLGEHIGRYEHVAEAFTRAGFAMLGFDLPGHGQTGGQRGYCSYEEAMQDIDCLMAEANSRFPSQPKFIYGHSLGGAIVLYYTLMRSPAVAGTIVTSPSLGVKTPGWKVALARTMSQVYPSFALSNGLDRQNLSHDPGIIQAYGADPLVHDRVTTRLGWDALSIGPKIVSMAGSYPVPLLLMQGTEDHIVSVQAVDEFAKNAPKDKITYKRWEGLYHETHNEPQKAQVIQAMVDWINQRISMVY